MAPERRPTIVLLHEGLGSISTWRDFPAALAERTRCGCFVYSRYGHGGSARLLEARDVSYMHHEAQVVLPEVLRQTGLEHPILFGHSDGASIALIFAAAQPQMPAALILEAPHVFVEDETVASIAAIKTTYTGTDLRSRLARHHAHPDETFYGWNDIWLDPRFRSWNIEGDLHSVNVPVLVIQGLDDEYGTADQVEAIRSVLPITRALLLEKCGHSPHRDQTEAVLTASAAFIAELTGESAASALQ